MKTLVLQNNHMIGTGLPDWPFHGQIKKIWPFFELRGYEKIILAISAIWPLIWPFLQKFQLMCIITVVVINFFQFC